LVLFLTAGVTAVGRIAFSPLMGQFRKTALLKAVRPWRSALCAAISSSAYGAHAKLYDSQKQYRTDMLAKWNVHTEQVCRMLKKAVSFRPIVNIQQFITENICDIPEKPDIEAMQQNIRDYKRHEQLAKRQEEKAAHAAGN
jgi:hypothetical protein